MADIQIDLPKGYTAIDAFPRQRESLINLIATPSGLIRRPGITSAATGTGACRGTLVQNGVLYKVLGTKLVRINSDNTTEDKGNIGGTSEVVMAPGFSLASIIVKGGNGYTFSESSGLTQINSPNFKASIDLAVVNSVTVYIPSDGGPAFFSDPNNPGTIQNTSFFDAEQLPDINTGVFSLNNDLFILGSDSSELFRLKGELPNPFVRVDGGATQIGYVSGHTLFQNTFVFIGKRRNESFSIRAMGQGDAQRISNNAIDELLNEEYTAAELRLARGDTFEWKGVPVLTLSLARHTLYFSGGNWAFFKSGVSGADTDAPWTAAHISFAYNKYYVGDSDDGKVGILSNNNNDYGDAWEWSLDTFVDGGQESFFSINSLTLQCLTGRSLAEETIGLTISSDGVVWQNDNTVWRGLGVIGAYSQTVDWALPGGLGNYDNFAGIRLRSTAEVDFGLESLIVDI